MVKINSMLGFCEDTDYLYISLLDNKPYYLVKLIKQYNVSKDIYIGNEWESSNIYEGFSLSTNSEYWCWEPLEFNRSVLYG